MATKKQKKELIEILKFTPIRVRMLIQGYGGEAYAGTVDRKTYDYFKAKKIDIAEYASDWNGQFNVPDEFQPFSPGSPYDCDNLFHASGAELSDLNEIRIDNDETNATIWEHNLGYGNLEDLGVTVNETGGGEILDLVNGDTDQVVFWGGQGEKGCFFDAEFILKAPFDPRKLTINYENCDDWYIITGVEYDGEELEGSGGYSTTGKWAEYKWVFLNDEEPYEPISQEDRSEEDVESSDDLIESQDVEKDRSPWYSLDVPPTIKGTYEVLIDAPWPNGGLGMAEWSGRTWKIDGKKVNIKEWRGLNYNPEKV